MLNIMAKTEKIHPELWRQHQVIVSPDLLTSLLPAYKNRNNKIITIEEILVSYPVNQVTYRDNPLKRDNTQGNGITSPDNPQRIGKDRIGKDRKGKENSCAFDRFWECYPKKKSKGNAEKAWKSIKPSEQLLATMIAVIETAKTSTEWMKEGGQFIPHPATWLRAKGWEDQGIEHPLAGKVSDTTQKNLRVMADWRKSNDEP